MLREYVDLPRSVHILCLGSFINRAGSFVLIFLTIYLSEQLGFEKTFAAQCMGVFGLGSIFASLIGGQLADQIGRKVVMLVALFGGGGLLIALSLATTKLSVLLTILVYSLVAETFRPACSAMLGDLTRPDQRPASFGLFYISINLGFACGPPIGGVLADISYDLLFWGDALTMCAFGCIILRFIPESRGLISTSGDQPLDDVPASVAARRIMSDGPFVLFCLATLLVALVFMQSVVTLPVYIKGAGYTNSEFGLFMAINGFLIFVAQLPLTHFFERFNPMGNVVGGSLLIAVGFGLYYLPVSTGLLIVAVLVWTIGEMIEAPFKQTVVTNLAPPKLRARYLGLLSGSYSLALTIGAPLGGFVLNRYGPQSFWSVCFVIGSVGVGIYGTTFRAITRRNDVVAAAVKNTRKTSESVASTQPV